MTTVIKHIFSLIIIGTNKMRKKELVKKLNELLEESRKYQNENNTYSGAFGYLTKGIELLIEDIEK